MPGCIERSRSPPLAARGRGYGFPSTLGQSPGPWISPGFTRAVHHLLQAYSYVFVMDSGYDVSYSSPVINHTQPVYATARPPRRRCQSRLSVGIRIAVYLSVCSKNLNFWRPKQWIPLGYCVLPTPDTDISILFPTADVWDFWVEPRGLEASRGGEVDSSSTCGSRCEECRCGGVMMCRRFPGDAADDLFRIRCALKPARPLCGDVPSVGTMICFPMRRWPQTRLHVTCGLFDQEGWCASG